MLHMGDHDQALTCVRHALSVIRQRVKSAGPGQGLPCHHSHAQPLLVVEQGTENEMRSEINNLIISVALDDSESAESQAARTPGNLFSFSYNHAFVVSALPSLLTRTSQQIIDHYDMVQTDDNDDDDEITGLISSVPLGDSESAESQAAAPGNLFSFCNHAFVASALPNMFTRTSSKQEIHYAIV